MNIESIRPHVKLIHKQVSHPACGFYSWFNGLDLDANKKQKLLVEFKKMPQGNYMPLSGDIHVSDILDAKFLKEILELFYNYIKQLASTPYRVWITNNTKYTLSVKWIYTLNDGQANPLGTYEARIDNLVPDDEQPFESPSCLFMNSYELIVYYEDQELYRTSKKTPNEINKEENETFGTISVCEDWWELT